MIPALLLAAAPLLQVTPWPGTDWSLFLNPTPGFEIPFDFVVEPDGSSFAGSTAFMSTALRGVVTHVSPDGVVLWRRTLAGVGLYGLASDGVGGVIAATNGSLASEPSFVTRFDAAGNEMWVRPVSGPSVTGAPLQNLLRTATSDGSGGILIGGSVFEPGVGLRGWLVGLDGQGDEYLNDTPFGVGVPTIVSIDRRATGDVAVASSSNGENSVGLLRQDGTVAWVVPIPAVPGQRLFKTRFSPFGDVFVSRLFFFSTTAPPPGTESSTLYKLSGSSGDLLAEVSFPATDGRLRILGLTPTADGGLIGVGSMIAPPNPPFQTAMLAVSIPFSADLEPGSIREYGPHSAGSSQRAEVLVERPEGNYVFGSGTSLVFVGANGFPGSSRPFVQRVEPAIGARYCGPAPINSTGRPATMSVVGSPLVTEGNVTLAATGLPPGTFSMFILGSEAGSNPIVGSSVGVLCVAGEIGRFSGSVIEATVVGETRYRIDPSALPLSSGIVSARAGETWHFQCWYRDQTPGANSNLTDGVAVTFQ